MSACGRVGIHSCLLSDFPTFCISRALGEKVCHLGGETTAVSMRKYGTFPGEENILIKT